MIIVAMKVTIHSDSGHVGLQCKLNSRVHKYSRLGLWLLIRARNSKCLPIAAGHQDLQHSGAEKWSQQPRPRLASLGASVQPARQSGIKTIH